MRKLTIKISTKILQNLKYINDLILVEKTLLKIFYYSKGKSIFVSAKGKSFQFEKVARESR